MKNRFFIILSLFLVVSMIGCKTVNNKEGFDLESLLKKNQRSSTDVLEVIEEKTKTDVAEGLGLKVSIGKEQTIIECPSDISVEDIMKAVLTSVPASLQTTFMSDISMSSEENKLILSYPETYDVSFLEIITSEEYLADAYRKVIDGKVKESGKIEAIEVPDTENKDNKQAASEYNLEEIRLAEEARIAAEKAAEEARLETEKAKEEKAVAEQAAEEARIAAEIASEEKAAAEEARAAAEKALEEARIAAEKAAEENAGSENTVTVPEVEYVHEEPTTVEETPVVEPAPEKQANGSVMILVILTVLVFVAGVVFFLLNKKRK